MRVFAYMRVSTDQQTESGAGLAAQLDSCRKWAEGQGLSLQSTFCDEGISGSTSIEKRPSLMDAINCLENGDVIVVAKRDRIGRDPIHVAMIEA